MDAGRAVSVASTTCLRDDATPRPRPVLAKCFCGPRGLVLHPLLHNLQLQVFIVLMHCARVMSGFDHFIGTYGHES